MSCKLYCGGCACHVFPPCNHCVEGHNQVMNSETIDQFLDGIEKVCQKHLYSKLTGNTCEALKIDLTDYFTTFLNDLNLIAPKVEVYMMPPSIGVRYLCPVRKDAINWSEWLDRVEAGLYG